MGPQSSAMTLSTLDLETKGTFDLSLGKWIHIFLRRLGLDKFSDHLVDGKEELRNRLKIGGVVVPTCSVSMGHGWGQSAEVN